MSADRSGRFRVPAIVIGLDCITGLQTARILADRGVPVVGLASNASHFAARTRAARSVVTTETSGQPLIDTLIRLADRFESGAVLFPCTDAAVATLSNQRAQLPDGYRLLLPDADTVTRLMDKARFETYARQAGLPIPHTRSLRDRSDAEAAARDLTFPAVLKPAVKTAEWQRHTRAKAIELADGDALLRQFDVCRQWTDELVVQEWVVGGEENLYSCNAYFDAESRPLATFVARKLRQWPVDTGTSCLGEEVRNDDVLDECLRLFGEVRFHGLAYLEMKRDARTGRHYIIEPNIGRPTGRSAIAEAGGVELLLTAYCDALGLPLPDARQQRYGHARWIYLRHDLQAAVTLWRAGRLGIVDWLRSLRGRKVDAVWSHRDPLPFVLDVWQAVGKARSQGSRPGAGPAPSVGQEQAA